MAKQQQWRALGPARWSGGRLVDEGIWHGTGVRLGRTRLEAEVALRTGRTTDGRQLPSTGLQVVEGPAGGRWVWDPEVGLRPLAS